MSTEKISTSDQSVGGQDRVTIRHVAEDAGVSVAAVSKVLRSAYGVSDQLRKKVEASIAKLNYRPSTAARGMRGRTYTIGVIVIDLSNPFLPNVLEGFNQRISKSGYKALIGVGRNVTQLETSMIEAMMDNRMDGVLLVAPRISGDMLDGFARRIPIVAIAHHENQATTYDTVNSDDRQGARLAVKTLLDRGHTDVVMLAFDEKMSLSSEVIFQREAGYFDVMQAAGLGAKAKIWHLPPPGHDRAPSIRAMLTSKDRPRAVFVWSDLDAIPLLSECRAAGIRVPEDLAIVGYDDSPPAAIPLVGLSSINQHPIRIGEASGDLLLSRIEGRATPQHLLIQPEIVIRSSC
jgi:LacI family transcriptional regulator